MLVRVSEISLKLYAVGGVIRDELLGLQSADADYVVVGSTPQEMVNLGYQPVGQDFPVFLHPQTREEYALARTERKTGKGYKGFSFHTDQNVTLEEDLSRRDLTINAMAQEVDQNRKRIGPIIDPFNGQGDLKNKIFRHISDAFEEDPLRILRLARFAARFPDFQVAPETQDLLNKMVKQGELSELVPERVWQEISRGLMQNQPSRMFEVLKSCKALEALLPVDLLNEDVFKNTLRELDQVAVNNLDLKLRFATLMSRIGEEQAKEWCEEQRIPMEERAYAQIFRLWREQYSDELELSPNRTLLFFDQVDLWRKPQRLLEIFNLGKVLGISTNRWIQAMEIVLGVDAGNIANAVSGRTGEEIKQAIHSARLKALEAAL